MKRWHIPAGLFYLFVFSFLVWGYKKKLQFNYPSSALFEVFGLDGSHHQGEILWEHINLQKFKFIYLKATEGESFKDKKFEENYKAASERKIIVGGYHFWTFCKSAEKQIQNIIETIPKKKGDLVPAIDIESAHSCGGAKPSLRLKNDLKILNLKLREHYGKLPVLYTTEEFSRAHPEVLEGPNHYWLRSLVGSPKYKSDWAIWQYYHAGRAKGIRGPVDLNVIRKKSLLRSLLQ